MINIFLTIPYLALVYYVFKQNKSFFVLLLLFLINHIWTIMSVAFIETGVYLIDTYKYGYFTGSTLRLLLYEMIFILSILFFIRKNKLNSKENIETITKTVKNSSLKHFCLVCLTIVNLYFLLNIAKSGCILNNASISRFNFYTTYSSLPFAQYLSYIIIPMHLLNGMLFISENKRLYKTLSLINVALSVVYLYLIGNEAMELIYVAIMFLIPVLINVISIISLKKKGTGFYKQTKNAKRRILFVGILAIIMVTFVLVNKYNFVKENGTYSQYVNSPVAAVAYRFFALQGNTWWSTDYAVKYLGFNEPTQVLNELSAALDDSKKYDAGIWFLMKNIMPAHYYKVYVEGNGTLNAGYPAIDIAIFGYLGAGVVVAVEGAIYFYMLYYLYNKIIRYQYIKAFLATTIWFQLNRVYTMGGIWYVFNLLPIICIVVLFLAELLEYKKIRLVFRKL